METIRMYMDNMFSRFPQSSQLLSLKEDMLRTMEDQYEELRSQGLSENEVIGSIISEFGNMDELAQELGLSQEGESGCGTDGNAVPGSPAQWTDAMKQMPPDSDSVPLSPAEVRQYLYEIVKYTRLSGFGAALLFPGSAALAVLLALLLPSGVENMSIARLLPLFFAGDSQMTGFSLPSFLLLAALLLIWTALSLILLLYGNGMLSQCCFLKSTPFTLDPAMEEEVQTLLQQGRTGKRLRLAAAVLLSCLSPVLLLRALTLTESGSPASGSFPRVCTGLILLFLLLTPALYLFLTAKAKEKACQALLKSCRLAEKKKNAPRFLAAGLSFLRSWYWVLVTLLYFLISFRYHNWMTSWLIWLIAPIGYSLLKSLQNALKPQKKA